MNKIPLTNNFIYEFQLDESLVEKSLQEILQMEQKLVPIEKIYGTSKAIYGKNWEAIYNKDLFDEIQKCVDEVCNLHFKQTKLVICDSWLTKSLLGDYSALHHHSYSIFSGLLYFTDHGSSETVFTIDDPFYTKHAVMFNHTIVPIRYEVSSKPKKGKLIIWDSSINHRISKHKDKKTRYTLAFNTWFTGVIGFDATAKLTAHTVDAASQSLNK